MACHHHLMLAALAAFCGAALASSPCSQPEHVLNFITGEPCPVVAETGKPFTACSPARMLAPPYYGSVVA